MADKLIVDDITQFMGNSSKKENDDLVRVLEKTDNTLDAIHKGTIAATKEFIETLKSQKEIIQKTIADNQAKTKLVLDELQKETTAGDLNSEDVKELTEGLSEFFKNKVEIDRLKKQIKLKEDADANPDEIERLKALMDNSIEKQKKIIHEFKDESDRSRTFKKIIQNNENAAIFNSENNAIILTNRELYELEKKSTNEIKARQEKYNEVLKIVNFIKDEVVSVYKTWSGFNAQAISDSKRLGITSIGSARTYTKNLIENSKELSRNFALSSEQAMKMQETFSKVTGKATLLTQSQMEDIAASSKLMGEETVSSAIEMMGNMGTTSQTATELLDKNYARAVNSGLDTVKASETFVKNLSLANKLTFKNGVDGISRMTMLSQKIKLNLQEVANVADKFSTIEGAIEGSAQLQMLGGTGAMLGGDPMQMMYEAMADPEALFERMGKMASSQATFNRKTGEAYIDPMQLAIMKEQAKAMGMNPDEFVQSAKQQASIRDIESQWRNGNNAVFNAASEEEKSAIENKAQYNKEKGIWEVSYLDETGEQQTVGVNELTPDKMKDIMKDNIEPVEDIRKHVREISMALIGTEERRKAMSDTWNASKAQGLNGVFEGFDDALTELNGSSFWKFITDGGWGTALGAAGGIGGKAIWNTIMGSLSKGKIPIPKIGGSSIASEVEAIKTAKNTAEAANDVKKAAEAANDVKKAAEAANNVAKVAKVSKLAKVAKLGGSNALLSAGIGVVSIYANNQEKKARVAQLDELSKAGKISDRTAKRKKIQTENEAKIKNYEAGGEAVGAIIGGALGSIAGPLGTVAGGFVGAKIGGWASKTFAKNFATNDADGIEKHLRDINDDGEKENIRRIVLPIESIDYNVSLIARQMGVAGAEAALGNVYVEEYGEAGNDVVNAPDIQGGEYVYQNENTNTYTHDNYTHGEITLNIGGTINLAGCGNGTLNANDFKTLLANNPSVKRELTSIITGNQNAIANGGKSNTESLINRQGTGYNMNFTS